MLLEDKMVTFVKKELKKIQKVLCPDSPECLASQTDNNCALAGEDEEPNSIRESFVKITLHILRRIKQEELADELQSRTLIRDVEWSQHELKSILKKKFQCVFEGIAKAGNPTLLNQIYTELYITEGGTAEVNDEHEVRQIETASKKLDNLESTIRQEDIFKASPGRDEPIRTVLTKGVAGIGKTVLTQKYTLDWAEDKANQDIHGGTPTVPETSNKALSVLSSQPSNLRELDLSNNNLQDSGVKILSTGLKSLCCTLETLSLSGCLLTEEGCTSLASALSSNPSHLKELDLSYNQPGDSGLKLLSAGLMDPSWRLDTLRVEPAGVRWLEPSLRKYSCQLTIDTNTVNTNLQLSDNNRTVTHVDEIQSYPDHPGRFDQLPQLLCRNGLTGRCYWEVEWRGGVLISVSYTGIRRKGNSKDVVFGWNDQSWCLYCSDDGPDSVRHNNKGTSIIASASSSSSVSNRAAVYVDCSAGTLSFYRVSSDTLIHLHTFNTTFTETLYPGFRVYPGCSLKVCVVEA
ncbi:hypothetical protein ACER0C_003140 [Sarotherodon galilaeus]